MEDIIRLFLSFLIVLAVTLGPILKNTRVVNSKRAVRNMLDPAQKDLAEQRVQEYTDPVPAPPPRPALSRQAKRGQTGGAQFHWAPRADGLWLPAGSADSPDSPDIPAADYPPPHRHSYVQQNRNPLGDALPDRVNERVRGQEGVWGDEGHSEHYRSAWLAGAPSVGVPAAGERAEINPGEIARGVIWAVVLAEPPGLRRMGRPPRRRTP
ncbi:MAG: hypothetical protein LBS10_10700 [Gracilibacteraceae bacterium]|jgi:hypothetical protein|nr:hypothetical protein [Gracilibacteraceae bacterium]